jgi:hypothetical protein
MPTTTAALLKQRNNRTLHFREVQLEDGSIVAQECEAGDEGAFAFRIAKTNGNQVGREAVQALVGEDDYVRFANWYAAEGGEAHRQARSIKAKVGDPTPFDDSMQTDETYQLHMQAVLKVMRRAVLRAGMRDPSYQEVGSDLGLFEEAVYQAIWTFGRELVTSDPKSSSPS